VKRTALAAGAGLAALATAAGCHHRRAEAPRPAPAAPPTQPGPSQPAVRQPIAIAPVQGEPVVRVGLAVDRDSALVSATGQYRVVDQAGGTLAVLDSGAVATVRPAERVGTVLLYRQGRGEPLALEGPVFAVTERPGDLVVVSGRRYRGDLIIQRGTAGVTVVNRAPLEAYLLSVVALELGFRNPTDREAVKAQAVAARTFAIRYRGRREALGFDIFPTDADQVYGGVESELPEVAEAVQATTGEILTWQGQPIQALFHSTCGWSTEAADQVFQNREQVPYLRAVSDRFGGGRTDYFCAMSPKFRWREEWDGAAINAILAQTLAQSNGGANVGRVTDLRVGKTTPTGRVAELVVTTSGGDITVPYGRVRDVLRPAPDRQLLSNLFQLHVERQGGELVRVVASGAGYGHGVGMCQFGAVGRARAGWDFRRILAVYYPGTKVERIY
jgi:stage II sporulation protein D